MSAVAALAGYLLGSLPTADWLARRAGVDLRAGGSGNPGANNARRLGGTALAARVLVVEAAKGAAAVLLGGWMAGSLGAVLSGGGATAGNILNPWYRFRGGQGLGITAGVLAAAWPAGMTAAAAGLVAGLALSGTSRWATLAAVAVLFVAGAEESLWSRWGWGIEEHHMVLAAGLGLLVGAKQVYLLVTKGR